MSRRGRGRRRWRWRRPAPPAAGRARPRWAGARHRRATGRCRSRHPSQPASPAGCARRTGAHRSAGRARPHARPLRRGRASGPRRCLPERRRAVRPPRPGAAPARRAARTRPTPASLRAGPSPAGMERRRTGAAAPMPEGVSCAVAAAVQCHEVSRVRRICPARFRHFSHALSRSGTEKAALEEAALALISTLSRLCPFQTPGAVRRHDLIAANTGIRPRCRPTSHEDGGNQRWWRRNSFLGNPDWRIMEARLSGRISSPSWL